MSTIPAIYYNGNSSQQHMVQLYPIDEQQISINGSQINLVVAITNIRLKHSILNSSFYLYLSEQACCEIESKHYNKIAGFLQQESYGQYKRRRIEAKLLNSFVCVALALIYIITLLQLLAAPTAKLLAGQIPLSIKVEMSKDVMRFMDGNFLKPSQISQAQQERIQNNFKKITNKYKDQYQFKLYFRQSKYEHANAFALPSGTIVITDQLIKQASSDDEIIAVLGHEIGHVVLNHSLRQILQDSAFVLTLYLLIGDTTMLSDLIYLAPTLMINAHYSRLFETEADKFSFDLLKDSRWNALAIIQFYKRHMFTDTDKTSENKQSSYFDSHPGFQQRIENLKKWERKKQRSFY